MPTVDFRRYGYIPSLLGGEAAQLAHDKLAPRTKAEILPIVELCWQPGARDFQHSLDAARTIGKNYPFLLDIDKRPPPNPYVPPRSSKPEKAEHRLREQREMKEAFEAVRNRLLQPSVGFANWRALTREFPNAVPILQVTNARGQRDEVLRQARLICAGGSSAGIRIPMSMVEDICDLAAQILVRVDDPKQILLIFDCGQGRSQLAKRSGFVADAFLAIRDRISTGRADRLQAVCMSNSFILPTKKGIQFIENYDREIWRRISVGARLAFGDYAATERRPHSSYQLWDWLPTIAHTLPNGWLMNRHENRNDAAGWVAGCKNVKADFRFSSIRSWCDRVIEQTAAAGSSPLARQRLWHAARMNGHMERQFAHRGEAIKKAA